jgi:hypothetical protein
MRGWASAGARADVHWLLERDVFGDGAPPLLEAARRAGHGVTIWRDDWWASGAFPRIDDERVVFHGSLGNAARIAALGRWSPGAWCDVERLRCSSWYAAAERWRLNERYVQTTVRELCEQPFEIARSLGDGLREVFVRPDSPLKPFSGRVVALEGLTPERLDHGFYYEDLELPIVIAPVTVVHEEWRFVVVRGTVVASSGYQAAGRSATTAVVPTEVATRVCQKFCVRSCRTSDGQTSFEFDRELVESLTPALGWTSPAFLGRNHGEVDQLEGRVVVGEVPLAVDQLAHARVERLDRVGRIEDAA